jgi:hypothetical protein
MSDGDKCGAETTQGHPCQNPADSCPWHGPDATAEPRKTALEEQPEITHLVAGELQNESTVPEACAEADISVNQYKDWYARGNNPDAKEIFTTFRTECRRARMVAAGSDREQVKNTAREQGDARTLWKAHMQQYGDIYAEEGVEDMGALPFAIPEELIEEWQSETH